MNPAREHAAPAPKCGPIEFHWRSADELDPLAFLAGSTWPRAYLFDRAAELEIAASGHLWSAQAQGSDRFTAIENQLDAFFAQQVGDDGGGLPWALGGFSFDQDVRHPLWQPFGAATWRLFQHQLVSDAAGRRLCSAYPQAPAPASGMALVDDLPPTDVQSWRTQVEAALAAIQQGAFRKVVIARTAQSNLSSRFVFDILSALRRQANYSALFAWEAAPGLWFLSATPELLLRRSGHAFETQAVAGTLRNGYGWTAKEHAEHQAVIDGIRESLAPHAAELYAAPVPIVKPAGSFAHLVTPMRGTLKPTASFLSAAGALHPTPALGGHPRQPALAWLAEQRHFERGWYGGAFGYAHPQNDCALFVGIRSALLTPQSGYLFAGAGIVAGSTPEGEWAETAWKLETLQAVMHA
jgi:salicylate biosynthesis isochorismate synthase